MKEDSFIKENYKTWNKLESLLEKLQAGKINKLNKNELDGFLNMYNLACGHLSYSRTYFGNTSTTEYLNRLVASSHSYIYTTKKSNIKDLFKFLIVEFPLLINSNIKPIMLSTFIFLLGTLISFVLTVISVDNAIAFFPAEMVEEIMNRDFDSHTVVWDAAIQSSFILTNNIRVGILVFIFGITLGVGSAYVLLYNGYMLGTLAGLYFLNNENLLFWSLILPHGIIELAAIFICGGAGLIIGYALINPGKYSRKDAFIIKGKIAIKLLLGTIPLYIVAGFIEGYFTPTQRVSDVFKIFFSIITLGLLVLYILIPNIKNRRADKNLELKKDKSKG
ncbi:stage II sporulation protein M [Herbivorax sp. ANBcel31]|uniref:stage II sporulation protein M n=1 Tax=Herbivorax sp. ANBcel31 TaxID=3069754 RepID=UPI0027B130DD|nr:stage II sporulation protein M [Herbivorax sp. ANBcel31]MDQ2086206.1 stage II sporulation protein M [Herbivorax sp. ANBcel31]